jgi:hypothetical protein
VVRELGRTRVSREALGEGQRESPIVESYAAGFDLVAAFFRLRGLFRAFGAAPLRTARALCSCWEADVARLQRSLRSFFSLK